GFVPAQPIPHALPPQLEGLVQLLPLLRFQNRHDSVLAARENSFRLPKIELAQMSQLVVNLLQDWPDLLFLIARQFHFRDPAHRRVRKPASRVTVASHFVSCRSHHKKRTRDHADNKSCNNQQNDFPSTEAIHGRNKQSRDDAKSDLFRRRRDALSSAAWRWLPLHPRRQRTGIEMGLSRTRSRIQQRLERDAVSRTNRRPARKR